MNAPAKNPPTLEPRPLYGIGTVARLTGLKPDTLRVWERRYGLCASFKSPSGRRQYTQSDLEHLQLIAALVQDGARIGEIASSERRTLELLVKGRGRHLERQLPPAKPRVVFVGRELCDWLDGHQGCIANANALLVRQDLPEVLDSLVVDGEIAMLVVDCPALSMTQIEAVEVLTARIGSQKLLVTYRLANDRWLRELERRGGVALEFPVEPARLAFELGRVVVDSETQVGEFDLGELVNPKPRAFTDSALRAAGRIESALDCECPRHLAKLIQSLNQFESYVTECSIENWQDAAVHSRMYTYANQARHLLEKSLQAVLEDRAIPLDV